MNVKGRAFPSMAATIRSWLTTIAALVGSLALWTAPPPYSGDSQALAQTSNCTSDSDCSSGSVCCGGTCGTPCLGCGD
jgi:hypothetical protein